MTRRGIDSRTAIAQKSDGSILMLVIDGRRVNSPGIDITSLQDVLIKYGAINAVRLPVGGNSTMYYKDEIINTPSNSNGEMKTASIFMVMPGDTTPYVSVDTAKDEFTPDISQTTLKLDNYKDLSELSTKIFDTYLKALSEDKVTDFARLKDYKIDEIKIQNGNEDKFMFLVTYSILPASDNFVLAGNGEKGSNGWINSKELFITVAKGKEDYQITGAGTGP
ncbi:MAG TPA: phosphodiester glycosidase family protein [Clostridiaceae bacterium]